MTTTVLSNSNHGVTSRSRQESQAASVDTWEAGELIRAVQSGRDFTGRILELTGIALADQDQGLVNLGSRSTFRSQYYLNFVSVFGVRRPIQEGQLLSVRVKVTMCNRLEMPTGVVVVVINTRLAE